MIIYKDPDTGYLCKAVNAIGITVPYREVPSHPRDEFNDAITDYDVDGNPVYDLVKAKEKLVKKANELCEQELKIITDQYSEAEMKTWDIQEAEARSTGATPFLDALAAASGKDKAALKAKIIANADAFKGISAQQIGRRQAMEIAITNATTIDELKAVTF